MMLKALLILTFLLFTSSNAESIYNGKCVDDFYIYDGDSMIVIKYSTGRTSYISESKAKMQELVSNLGFFTFNRQNGKCELALKKYYGLNEMQFNFLSALTGLLTAFLIVSTIQKRI